MSAVLKLPIKSGTVLVGGDGHYWPGPAPTAHRVFVRFIQDLRPDAVIYNGDALDGSRISRHARIGWENQPLVWEELEVCKDRLGEIEDAAAGVDDHLCKIGPSDLIWTLGNHDQRFETRLAAAAPEYEHIQGMHLKDHFPAWRPCWAVRIGDTVIKHRGVGGVHAGRNNVLKGGVNMVTGHTHQLGVAAVTDYSGTRYGVEHGMLGDPGGPMFVDYLEAGPTNWRAGFVVLRFERGKLLWPEVVHVRPDGRYEWQGKEYRT